MTDTVTGNFFSSGNDSYETLRKIGALNMKAFTRLAGLQFELATLGVETSVAQAKLLALSKNYDQLYAHETMLANLYGNRIAEISRETTDTLLKSGDELNAIISQIFTVAKQGITAAVTTAPPVKPVVQAEIKAVTKKPSRRKAAKKAK